MKFPLIFATLTVIFTKSSQDMLPSEFTKDTSNSNHDNISDDNAFKGFFGGGLFSSRFSRPFSSEFLTFPKFPSMPQFPKPPKFSHLPEFPTIPELPEFPTIPSLPEFPTIPSLPEFPTIPSLPEFPTIPGFPDLFDWPDFDEIAKSFENSTDETVFLNGTGYEIKQTVRKNNNGSFFYSQVIYNISPSDDQGSNEAKVATTTSPEDDVPLTVDSDAIVDMTEEPTANMTLIEVDPASNEIEDSS
ncbi:uncharacterized protein [Palaemon carinicauda]|uniref:uncharacterized protein n=1 Tax=Palaemon carinicauda TaxID=392227 RepID=UPI0035B66894